MSLNFRFFLIFLVFPLLANSQQKTDGKNDTKKLFGEASITTNYVDKGVSQSDKAWALQSGFGYRMGPQARLGVWASSVKYPDINDSVNARYYFDVKMDISPNSNVILRYDFNRYYSSGTRDGALFSVDFSTLGYHILLEMNDNWEGTNSRSTWYGVKKDFALPWSIILNAVAGYTQLSASGYSNYIDTRASLGYMMADLLLELVHTYNTNASQFNGRGDMSVFLMASVKF